MPIRATLDRLAARVAKLAQIPLAGEMHIDMDALFARERRHRKLCAVDAPCGDCARCKPCEPPCADCDPLAHFRAMPNDDLVDEERERQRIAHIFRDRSSRRAGTVSPRDQALATVLAERGLR
jgi:hypothetical protein